jgi:exodeoxyribonuclease-3
MKLISFNVNGIRAAAKKGLHTTLRELDADVYCFQETKANDEQVNALFADTGQYQIHVNSAKRPGYSGTAIAAKNKPLRWFEDMAIEEHDREGRLTGAEFDDFYLVNVYVPNSGSELARLDYRQTWDVALRDFMVDLEKTKPVILCGDLNVAHRPIDLARPKPNYNKSAGYTQQEIDGLDRLLDAGYVDSFRYFYPDKVKYSWWSFRANARAKNIGWRLDYFLVSEQLKGRLKDAFILNGVMGSDHCPVGIELV